MKSMVFCGIFPIESSKFEDLREALSKLKLMMHHLSLNRKLLLHLGLVLDVDFGTFTFGHNKRKNHA